MKSRIILCAVLSATVLFGAGGFALAEEPTTQPATAPTESTSTETTAPSEESGLESWPQSKTVWPTQDDNGFKPRIELFVPSVKKLQTEAARSHTRMIVEKFAGLLGGMETFARTAQEEIGNVPEEARQENPKPTKADDETPVSGESGAGFGEAIELLKMIRDWPETSIIAAVYAPDVEGRPRFAIRFDYSAEDMKARLDALLAHDAADKLLKGVEITKGTGGGYAIELSELATVIAHLVPANGSQCWIKSHVDLEPPTSVWGQPANGDSDRDMRLVYCSYNLTGTEKDSGSILGDVPWISSIKYWCQVNETGEWEEQFAAFWNGLVAMGAQQVISKVEKSYNVPAESYAAAVFGFPLGAMLDGMLELPFGSLDISGKSETCVCVLPGEGFFPIPDVVIQLQVSNPDEVIENLVEAAEEINNDLAEDEQPPIWFEMDVDGRRAFWRQPDGGGMYTPFLTRPVLFVQDFTDTDGEIRKRLIVAMTSTKPENMVRRWVRGRSADELRTMPTADDLHWQAVINWKQVYELSAPWLNLMASFTPEARLLPDVDEMNSVLVDSRIDVQRKAAYLRTFHTGPVPVGAAYIPTIIGMAAGAETAAGSDLARERLAVRNLRVLYHHSKLFKKDYNRWPAEVWELQGYVDFSGNPQLLHLPKSSKNALTGLFENMFGKTEEEKEDEVEEWEEVDEDRPDTSIYVINWGETKWTLGYEPGTLDHLESLYIDQDGEIHRIAKGEGEEDEPADPTQVSVAPVE